MNKMITQNQMLKFFSEIKTHFRVCCILAVLLLISDPALAQNQGAVSGITGISIQSIANNKPIIYQQAKTSAVNLEGLGMEITPAAVLDGEVACSQNNPSNDFQIGYATSKNGPQLIATDITVPADIDFTLNTITVNISSAAGVTILSADIVLYNNAAGIPGTIKETQTAMIPVSQTVIGSNSLKDISEVIFDITPVLLEGQTGSAKTYWVSLYLDMSSGGNGYLESTSLSIAAYEQAFSVNAGETWFTNTGWDSAYLFEGECEPASDGGYCGPVIYEVDVEPITLVEVAGISNRTNRVINGSSAHEDFTTMVGNMIEGYAYTIALEGNTNGDWTSNFTVFIDWNQDKVLDNDTERYNIGTITGSTGADGNQLTAVITVPAGVALGLTRMRVMKQLGPNYTANSCIGMEWGQAEDYSINITNNGGFTAPYCGAESNNVEPITLVNVAGINNWTTNIINDSPGHEDFTNIVGNMVKGKSYVIALKGNTDGPFTNRFTVFIDWNQDGILDSETERFEIGTISNSTGLDGHQAIGTIAVPTGATEGVTRMRVIKSSSSYATNPCTGPYVYRGQAEDYTINVMPEPCENTLRYPLNAILASSELIEISTCNLNGDYSKIDGVVSGESYEFTAYDNFNDMYSYITVRTGASDGDFVGSGFSPLTITAPSNANLFIHWNSDSYCGKSGTCMASTVQCTTCGIVECTNQYAYGITDVSTPGTKEISDCNWFEEYAIISGVNSGYEYEFTGAENTSGNLAYITVHSGVYNGTIIGAGWSPLSITALSSDNLYVHYNSDANCGISLNCATTTATCISCPIETTLTGSVDWNSNCGERNAAMQFYEPGTSSLIGVLTVYIQADGSFNIPNVPSGMYDVTVKVSGYLAKGIQIVVIEGESNSLALGAIVFGDLNDDNIVDFIDLGALSAIYLSQVGSGGYNPIADSNCDGIIDFVDLGALSGSYLIIGDAAPIAAAQ